MNRAIRQFVLCLCGAFLLIRSAMGGDYSFTPIAILGDGVTSGFGAYPPMIDQNGFVTFARSNIDGLQTISRGASAATLTDVIVPGSVTFVDRVNSNNLGQVAFFGKGYDVAGRQVLRAQGGVITPIATGETFKTVVINDSGLVVFNDFSNGETYTSADPTQPLNISAGRLARLNNSGAIAYYADAIKVREPNGDITTIAEPDAKFVQFAYSIDRNEAGDVIFGALFIDGEDLVGGVFLSKQGVITPIVDTTGPIAIDNETTMALNNLGEVAFRAILDTGGTGIYTGPDLVANKVIEVGDSLAGSTVTALTMEHGLNDAGQIAFWAEFADGRSGIFRADPVLVPEPSALALAGVGGLILALVSSRRRGGGWRSVDS